MSISKQPVRGRKEEKEGRKEKKERKARKEGKKRNGRKEGKEREEGEVGATQGREEKREATFAIMLVSELW